MFIKMYPKILRRFRVIVGLKTKRVRPNDDTFGDMVELQHIFELRVRSLLDVGPAVSHWTGRHEHGH